MVLLDDLALTLSLLGFVFGLVLGILYNFPWIFKYYKPIFVEYRKQADDKILIISDLHMHPEKCTFQFLENILKQHGITTVVIAGDFLETFLITAPARSDQKERLIKSSGISNALIDTTSGPRRGPKPASSIPAIIAITI